jgi:hypothetical protein
MAIASFRAGEAIATGEAVYVTASGFIHKASSSNADQARVVGIALTNGALNDVVQVNTDGVYASASGLTQNEYQFLSVTTSGVLVNYTTWATDLESATTPIYLTNVGRATSSTTLSVEIQPPIYVLPPPVYLLLETGFDPLVDAILLEDGSPIYLESALI